MKLSIAAAAIAFSGTALMLAPAAASAAQVDSKPQATAKAGWDAGGKDAMGGKDGLSGKDAGVTDKFAATDHEGMGGPLEEPSGKDGTSVKLASADVDGKFDTADMDMEGKFASADIDMASSDKLAATDHGMSGKAEAGIGGPEEPIASAKQATDRNSSEPVEAAAVTKNAAAPDGSTAGQGKEAHSGMGGPEEATTEYPPCSPGAGDDRCIQLYERGVGGSAKSGKSGK